MTEENKVQRVSDSPQPACSAEVLTGAEAHEAIDHAIMNILSDVYGAYHLIPESDRNEYETKYGYPPR